MGQISQWFAAELLKTAFNRDTYVPAYDTLAVALVTTVPPVNADISTLTEPVGNGYARAPIPYNTANWVMGDYREVYNALDVLFPTATGYWGQIEGYVVLSAFLGTAVGAVVDYTNSQTAAVGQVITPVRVTTGVQLDLPAQTVSFGIYDAS